MKRKSARTASHRSKKSANDYVYLGGVALVLFGIILLVGSMMPGMDFGRYWPFILIAVGLGVLWYHTKK